MKVDKDNLPEEIPVGKAEDLRGMVFGDLQVLYRIKDKRVCWLCRCLLCGNYCTAYSNNLKRMKVFNCGCDIHKYNHNRLIDLTGEVFGRLTVVKQAEDYISPNGTHLIAWWCKCSCGEPDLIYVLGNNLKRGLTQSCGCYHKDIIVPDLVGKEFGNLLVLKRDGSDENRSATWVCLCKKCGNSNYRATTGQLNSGYNSCGCVKSKGEETIINIFNNNNLSFISQMTFDTCRFPDTNKLARFDFFIGTEDPCVIEYHGEQHYMYSGSGWNDKKNYINTINRDLYKAKWCYDNDITLKVIPYTFRDSITLEDILSDRFIITPKTHPQYYPNPNMSYPYYNEETIDKYIK